MSLRDEVAKIIETENSYGYYAPDRTKELADFILALIDEYNQDKCYLCKHPNERETY